MKDIFIKEKKMFDNSAGFWLPVNKLENIILYLITKNTMEKQIEKLTKYETLLENIRMLIISMGQKESNKMKEYESLLLLAKEQKENLAQTLSDINRILNNEAKVIEFIYGSNCNKSILEAGINTKNELGNKIYKLEKQLYQNYKYIKIVSEKFFTDKKIKSYVILIFRQKNLDENSVQKSTRLTMDDILLFLENVSKVNIGTSELGSNNIYISFQNPDFLYKYSHENKQYEWCGYIDYIEHMVDYTYEKEKKKVYELKYIFVPTYSQGQKISNILLKLMFDDISQNSFVYLHNNSKTSKIYSDFLGPKNIELKNSSIIVSDLKSFKYRYIPDYKSSTIDWNKKMPVNARLEQYLELKNMCEKQPNFYQIFFKSDLIQEFDMELFDPPTNTNINFLKKNAKVLIISFQELNRKTGTKFRCNNFAKQRYEFYFQKYKYTAGESSEKFDEGIYILFLNYTIFMLTYYPSNTNTFIKTFWDLKKIFHLDETNKVCKTFTDFFNFATYFVKSS
jgi:hypothetical protein